MLNRTKEVDLSNYVANGEWELLSVSTQLNNVVYSCCDEPYPDITFSIFIRRRNLYYIINVITPSLMMSILTVFVFCLPPDSDEKITMGISVLLAFSVCMLTVAEDLPATSDNVPLLSVYLTTVMAMNSVSVIMTVLVLNFHHRGPDARPVPPCLRRLFVPKKKPDQPPLCDQCEDDLYPEAGGSRNKQPVTSITISIDGLVQELREGFAHHTQDGGRKPSSFGLREMSVITSATSSRSTDNARELNDAIFNLLMRIVRRSDKEDVRSEIVQEWRIVALAVDRILFWVFLLGTLTSTLFVLVVVPKTRYLT